MANTFEHLAVCDILFAAIVHDMDDDGNCVHLIAAKRAGLFGVAGAYVLEQFAVDKSIELL